MMKKTTYFVFLLCALCQYGWLFAQENEAVAPKGQLLDNPVFSLPKAYKTLQTVFDGTTADNWSKNQWSAGAVRPDEKSSRFCFYTGRYANNTATTLQSRQIQLPTLNSAGERLNLYLNQWYELESGHDKGLIEVSNNAGKTWKTVAVSTGKSAWRASYVNLTAYAGQTIQVRFRLVADASHTYKGWYVNQVSIRQEVLKSSLIPAPARVTKKGSQKGPNDPLQGTLTSLDARVFPRFIYANLNISDGLPASKILDESNFSVTENGAAVSKDNNFKVYPPTSTTEKTPVDIVFLMDNSGSMGDEQQQVAQNVESFANELDSKGFNYRLGLCRFGQGQNSGKPIFHNNAGWYTNAADYVNVWDSVNTVNGSREPSWDALYYSSSNYTFRTGAQKIFILITDELASTSQNLGTIKDRQVVIDQLKQAGVTTYSIVSAGTSFDNDFGTIATATGGRSYNITSPFNDILDDIQNQITSNYTLRYFPEDPIFDGKVRNVEITVDCNGKTLALNGSYTPGAAPTIFRTDATLAIHKDAQPENDPVKIEVEVIDRLSPYAQSVTLFYRTIGTSIPGNYKSLAMTRSGSGTNQIDTWSVIIPGGEVTRQGMEYYVKATDGQATTTAPEILDLPGYPYSFAVLPNIPPVVNHTPVTQADPSTTVTIKTEVIDNTNAVGDVYLYYKEEGAPLYTSVAMQGNGANEYEVTINTPATNTNVLYYIRASDNFGIVTEKGSPVNPFTIAIGSPWSPNINNRSFHTIRFLPAGPFASTVAVGGKPLEDGDVIAAFYTDGNGVLQAGGTVIWKAGAANALIVYGDNTSTPEKDGFAAGETFTFQIFKQKEGRVYQAAATLHPVSPINFHTFTQNKMTFVKELNANVTHTVQLLKGENTWSTYLIPEDTKFDILLQAISSEVISVSDLQGHEYVPGANNNTLTDYKPGYGYKIDVKNDVTLTVTGVPLEATGLKIQLGEQTLIGCPYPSKEDVENVFGNLGLNIYIVDRYVRVDETLDVQTYSPAWGFNDWTDKNLEPGKAYMVYAYVANALEFPAPKGLHKAARQQDNNVTKSTKVTSIADYGHLYVPAKAWKTMPSLEDEVRVYSAKGELLGATLFNAKGNILTVDGSLVAEGEDVTLKLWKHQTGKEEAILVTNWAKGSEAYQRHNTSVVAMIDRNDASKDGFEIYPNPAFEEAKISFALSQESEVNITIYDQEGNVAKRIQKPAMEEGLHKVGVNVQDLERGYYLVKLQSEGAEKMVRIFIEK